MADEAGGDTGLVGDGHLCWRLHAIRHPAARRPYFFRRRTCEFLYHICTCGRLWASLGVSRLMELDREKEGQSMPGYYEYHLHTVKAFPRNASPRAYSAHVPVFQVSQGKGGKGSLLDMCFVLQTLVSSSKNCAAELPSMATHGEGPLFVTLFDAMSRSRCYSNRGPRLKEQSQMSAQPVPTPVII